jgi:hypothetical protein
MSLEEDIHGAPFVLIVSTNPTNRSLFSRMQMIASLFISILMMTASLHFVWQHWREHRNQQRFQHVDDGGGLLVPQ